MTNLSELGNIIQSARKKHGLSPTQLAAKLFIDPSAISKIEKGKYKPSNNLLSRLALCLELDLSILSFLAGRPANDLQEKLECLYKQIGYYKMLDAIEKFTNNPTESESICYNLNDV